MWSKIMYDTEISPLQLGSHDQMFTKIYIYIMSYNARNGKSNLAKAKIAIWPSLTLLALKNQIL